MGIVIDSTIVTSQQKEKINIKTDWFKKPYENK